MKDRVKLDSDKLNKIKAAIGDRYAVVDYIADVQATVYPARMTHTIEALQVLGSIEDNLVGLISCAFDQSLTEDERLQHMVGNLVAMMLHADCSGLIEVVQKSTDVPLDEPGIPPMAVAVVAAKWILLTFDPEINGPFVEQIKKMVPGSVADLVTDLVSEGPQTPNNKEAQGFGESPTPTSTGSVPPSGSSVPPETPNG